MLGLVEVCLAGAIGLSWLYHQLKSKRIEEEIRGEGEKLEGLLAGLEGSLREQVREALEEFEDLADEVIPENPDPFEAMEIMRANMVNQVLGMGVQWFANKFTKVEMGVHQLENVDKPSSAQGEVWHDVDAEQQREGLAEIAGSM
jgi:hypothetical protein